MGGSHPPAASPYVGTPTALTRPRTTIVGQCSDIEETPGRAGSRCLRLYCLRPTGPRPEAVRHTDIASYRRAVPRGHETRHPSRLQVARSRGPRTANAGVALLQYRFPSDA